MEILNCRTLVHPTDLDRSIAFYRDRLGLATAYEFGAGSTRGVVFFAGGGYIEVVGRTADAEGGPHAIGLWLQVRDVVATVDELAAGGVSIARSAVVEPWGLFEAWIDDPDGNRIHLVEVPPEHPLRRDPRAADDIPLRAP